MVIVNYMNDTQYQWSRLVYLKANGNGISPKRTEVITETYV